MYVNIAKGAIKKWRIRD